jgi:peptidoglycan/LPS O-acetylase OafA/YrhL
VPPGDEAPTSGRGEIRSLTGLRGVAACWVVLFHYATAFQYADLSESRGRAGSAGLRLAESVVAHGYLAVDLFFVLSGFVMALTYGGVFRAGLSGRAYLDFLGKRLGRIYPLYIVLTLAVAALRYARIDLSEPPSPVGLASNVLLVQAWGIADSIDVPAWSISTEFAAYLLFPLLVGLVLFGRWAVCGGAVLAAAMTLVLVATRTAVELHQVVGGTVFRGGPLDASRFATLYPLLRCFAGFTLGLFAFRLTQVRAVRRILGWRFAGDAGGLALLGLVAVPGSDVVLVLLCAPVVAALATGRSYAARSLSGSVAHWLGKVSYSIYLVHYPTEELLHLPLRAALDARGVPHAVALSGLLILALVLALSAVTYHAVERPGRDWVRRLLGKRSALPIASEPAAP